MDTQPRIQTGISWIAALALILLPASLLRAAQTPASKVDEEVGAQQLVREMVRNEVSSQKGDQIYWRYREIDKSTGGNTKTYQIYETKDGNVRMLIGLNGEALTPSQRQSQESRLRRLLNNPAQARKAAQARHHDGDKERRMLKMLPNAFLFHYDGTEGKFVRLKFKPNPDFSPPTREAQVFHHMAGKILVDPQQKRLAEINGRLISEVKFFWGLLGHLNKGGTFHVKQVDLGKGHWRLSQLDVNMQGVALFFKTIGVQENERYEDYHANPPGMTLRQAVAQIEKTTYSAGTAKPSKGSS
jgi:hypothetical protein